MEIVLVGAKNPQTARDIRDAERHNPNLRVVGFIDNDPSKAGTSFLGLPVIGGFERLSECIERGYLFVNLITGSTRIRYETSRFMAARGCAFTNLIHSSVDLTMTKFGIGNYIQEGVIIQAEARIGDNSSMSMGALVAHESCIGSSVFIAPGCSVAGLVTIGDGTFLGTNATILPRIRIGRWATVGAGAVVIRDVPNHATVVGNPARVTKVREPVDHDGDIFARSG